MSKSFVVFLAVLGAAMALAGNSKKDVVQKSAADVRADKVSVAPFTCERLAKTTLRDPESYQRKTVDSSMGSPVAGYDYRATIQGRAKNGFGGYVNTAFTCDFKFGSDEVKVSKLG